jgi:GTPase SAR1 family protein
MIGKKIRGYIPSYKIIILGAKFVGKTQLVYRFVNNSFQSIYEPTVEAKSYKKIIDLNENNAVDADYCILEIVDLFSPLHPLLQMKKERVSESDRTLFDYMEKQKDIAICNQSPEQEAYAYIIVFDRTSRQSFQKVCMLLFPIRNNALCL